MNMNDKLQDRILKEIDKKEIEPLPKSIFIIKTFLIWLLFWWLIISSSVLLTFIISLFVSLKNETSLQINFFETLLNSISYIPLPTMIIILLIFLIWIILLKNSTNLYKYTWMTLFLITFVFIIIAWNLIYIVIWNEKLKELEFIKQWELEFKERIWNRPEKWFFIGKVIVIKEFEEDPSFYQIILENKNNNLFNLLVNKEELKSRNIKIWEELKVFWNKRKPQDNTFFQLKELKR